MEPEDLDLLYRIENDIQLWNVGTTNVPYSRYTLHDYIAHSANDIYTDRQVRLIIESLQGEQLGVVDLVHFDPQHRRAEVGIVILDRHRRKGYATSTLREIARYASSVLHLHQLYAITEASHQVACHLFEQAGFGITAPLPQWLYDGHDYHDALLMQKML